MRDGALVVAPAATRLEAAPPDPVLEVALPARTDELLCDVHPTMVGTRRVAGANSPPCHR